MSGSTVSQRPPAASAARRPPAAAPPRPFRFPPFERHRLGNGLTVLAARRPRLPLVRLDLLAPAGAVHDPAGKAGLATLTATLLDEGERGGTATELAEQLGGTLHCGATWNTANVNVSLHAVHLAPAAGLLAQTFFDSTFPEPQIDRLKRQRLANLLQQEAEPRFLAEDRLARALHGGTAYGRSPYGDRASVSSLERDDFSTFYARHYSPVTATLVAVGDLEVDRVLRLAEPLFASEATAGSVPLPPPPAPPPAGPELHVVDRPPARHVELRLGCVTVALGHPDSVPLHLAASLLGGTSISRINRTLRETLGITYGVSAQVEPRLGSCVFVISTAVAAEDAGTAVARILAEIRRLGEEPVPPAELEDAKSFVRGKVVHRLQSIEGLVNQLSLLAVHDLPLDHFDHDVSQLDEIEGVALQKAARMHLEPARFAVVAVGPSARLLPQLEPSGPVQVWPAAHEPT